MSWGSEYSGKMRGAVNIGSNRESRQRVHGKKREPTKLAEDVYLAPGAEQTFGAVDKTALYRSISFCLFCLCEPWMVAMAG